MIIRLEGSYKDKTPPVISTVLHKKYLPKDCIDTSGEVKVVK